MKRLNLRVPDRVYEKLKEAAKISEQTINSTAKQAIEKGCKYILKQMNQEWEKMHQKLTEKEIEKLAELAKTPWIEQD